MSNVSFAPNVFNSCFYMLTLYLSKYFESSRIAKYHHRHTDCDTTLQRTNLYNITNKGDIAPKWAMTPFYVSRSSNFFESRRLLHKIWGIRLRKLKNHIESNVTHCEVWTILSLTRAYWPTKTRTMDWCIIAASQAPDSTPHFTLYVGNNYTTLFKWIKNWHKHSNSL